MLQFPPKSNVTMCRALCRYLATGEEKIPTLDMSTGGTETSIRDISSPSPWRIMNLSRSIPLCCTPNPCLKTRCKQGTFSGSHPWSPPQSFGVLMKQTAPSRQGMRRRSCAMVPERRHLGLFVLGKKRVGKHVAQHTMLIQVSRSFKVQGFLILMF